MIDLDQIRDIELRGFAFHGYIDRPVNYRLEFEITNLLDSETNDQKRTQRVANLRLRPFTHPQVPNGRGDLGLELDWQKLGEVYVPAKWKEYMQDKTRDWNMGFIGVLSWDEMLTIQDFDLLARMNFDYNRQVLQLTPHKKIERLIADPDWRNQIKVYSQTGLEQYKRNVQRELSSTEKDSVQQSYLFQIISLIDRYISETSAK